LISLTLPYPPSANNYWRVFKNRILVSREARAYKARVKLEHARLKPLAGPLSVSVAVYRPQRRGDLDNVLKVTLDALNGVAFEDDSQVVRLFAQRLEDKARPRIEVIVMGVEP
jgi:crossover junction endodeoxyribonuclease RusA